MFISDVFIDWNKIPLDSYVRKIRAISGLEKISFSKPLTFFVGENGSGKSTLLEAIAITAGFNPEGGTKNYAFSTFDSHSELCGALRLSKKEKEKWGYFLRAESFYNVATKEIEYSKGPGGVPLNLHERSHGESFLTMLCSHFSEKGLYLLDEPEAALSPQRQLTLLLEMDQCIRQGAQFIVATHSPILLGMPDADIRSFDDGKLHKCSYEDTESYQITAMFINHREQVLKQLLKG